MRGLSNKYRHMHCSYLFHCTNLAKNSSLTNLLLLGENPYLSLKITCFLAFEQRKHSKSLSDKLNSLVDTVAGTSSMQLSRVIWRNDPKKKKQMIVSYFSSIPVIDDSTDDAFGDPPPSDSDDTVPDTNPAISRQSDTQSGGTVLSDSGDGDAVPQPGGSISSQTATQPGACGDGAAIPQPRGMSGDLWGTILLLVWLKIICQFIKIVLCS